MVGLVGAALVYVLSLREWQREQYVECRLRVIAEMNHHIRNALQVITFYTRKGQKQEVGIVEAVERIQWALREVLPQLPEQPAAKAKESERVFDIQKFRATHCGSLN
jgi:1,2-phenylacetyl-CoA epoxidase catalytic subunit